MSILTINKSIKIGDIINIHTCTDFYIIKMNTTKISHLFLTCFRFVKNIV